MFVNYTDEKVDATVKSWNVKFLGLNRQSRHRDATVAQARPRPAPCSARCLSRRCWCRSKQHPPAAQLKHAFFHACLPAYLQEFWRMLDAHLQARSSTLLY